jgi:S-adenosylmethionine decarboxylase
MGTAADHMNVGVEWMIDARGCDAGRLADLGRMRAFCERVIRELELKVIGGGQWHQFPAPGGVTGLYLLSESHLACHTYPELGVVTFNLYCCRPRPRWSWEARLREALGASVVAVKRVARDAAGEDVAPPSQGAGESAAVNPSALEVANS